MPDLIGRPRDRLQPLHIGIHIKDRDSDALKQFFLFSRAFRAETPANLLVFSWNSGRISGLNQRRYPVATRITKVIPASSQVLSVV